MQSRRKLNQNQKKKKIKNKEEKISTSRARQQCWWLLVLFCSPPDARKAPAGSLQPQSHRLLLILTLRRARLHVGLALQGTLCIPLHVCCFAVALQGLGTKFLGLQWLRLVQATHTGRMHKSPKWLFLIFALQRHGEDSPGRLDVGSPPLWGLPFCCTPYILGGGGGYKPPGSACFRHPALFASCEQWE